MESRRRGNIDIMNEEVKIKHVGRSRVTGRALQPPESVTISDKTIELPDAETQKIGFSLDTVEKTLEVARTFPFLYKIFRNKG